jgi:peptide-methionine (R)-S-oxide reductase
MSKTHSVESGQSQPSAAKEVTIVDFDDSCNRKQTVIVPKVVKSDSEWQHQLTPDAYQITRHDGTERAFSGQYWNEHAQGIYRCACCDTALFESNTKYESGSGWPSFWQPIASENVETIEDRTYGMKRIAVSCKRCGAHLGHVFDDGPDPTGQRYCMNSASLRLVKSEK